MGMRFFGNYIFFALFIILLFKRLSAWNGFGLHIFVGIGNEKIVWFEIWNLTTVPHRSSLTLSTVNNCCLQGQWLIARTRDLKYCLNVLPTKKEGKARMMQKKCVFWEHADLFNSSSWPHILNFYCRTLLPQKPETTVKSFALSLWGRVRQGSFPSPIIDWSFASIASLEMVSSCRGKAGFRR